MLHAACEEGRLDQVRELVTSSRHKIDEWCLERTPLYVAARWNRLEVVRWLVEAGGAQIDVPGGPQQRTPFFVACREGSLDVVKYFASQGCNVDKLHHGVSPFFEACWRGHLQVAKFLFEQG